MYETQFGLSAPPFQLSPDPAFYFDSKGHSNALAYLKFGAYQGEGFIVVTGDIGAGKTTLVRTLLGELNPDQVVAAQVVSTQLESGDLLRSIATAFGIPQTGSTSKSQLIASLEAFLTSMAASGRRSLLVIDEAQNLPPEAIEEMRMLSNFQLDNQALLQSFLVGQPELRKLLESKSMEQFRQRVIASCHLGPMDAAETRAYIEHRLRHVGWHDTPHFEDAAFEAIHRWTGGIPRRINLLCNRLLLAAYLGGDDSVSQATVDSVATELHGEIGEARVAPIEGRPRSDYLSGLRAANLPVLDREVRLAAEPEPTIVRRIHVQEAASRQALICIVDTPLAFMKACALSLELARFPDLPPVLAVNPGPEIAVAPSSEVAKVLAPPPMEVHLDVTEQGYVDVMTAATRRFATIVDEFRPLAVFSQGHGDAVLACSLAASKARIPVLRLDAGQRNGDGKDIDELNNVVMDRLADVLCTNRLTAHYTLNREGIASGRVYCFGSLMSNVTHALRPHLAAPQLTLKRLGAPRRLLEPAGRYILATAQYGPQASHATDSIAGMVATLGLLRGVAPVIWAVGEETQAAITAAELDRKLKDASVFLLPPQGYLDALGILSKAACVVVGSQGGYAEEAAAMGVPIVGVGCPAMAASRVDDGAGAVFARDTDHAMRLIHEAVMNEPDADVPEYWDGGPAARLAEHLRHWLPQQAVSSEGLQGRALGT